MTLIQRARRGRFAAICLGGVAFASCSAGTHAADLGATASAPVADSSVSADVDSNSHRYFRVDASFARNGVSGFSQADLEANGGEFISDSLGTQGSIGLGAGYRFNSWLRFDVTGEYRIPASVKATDNLTAEVLTTGDLLQANTDYRGRLSSLTGLVNLYVDLPIGGRITPYIGAGIGASRNEVSNLFASGYATLTDPTTGQVASHTSFATAGSKANWELAWALMAGFSVDISDDVKLDAGYRYLDLGSSESAMSDLIRCVCGAIGQPLVAEDLHAHEFRIGLRFELGRPTEPARYAPLK